MNPTICRAQDTERQIKVLLDSAIRAVNDLSVCLARFEDRRQYKANQAWHALNEIEKPSWGVKSRKRASLDNEKP